TETARENFSGIRVIKAFVQELKEIQKFEKANGNNKKKNLQYIMLMNMMFPFVMAISSIAFAIGLWFGGILVIREQITLGQFIAFNSYLGMLVWPISSLGWVISIFQKGLVSLKRVGAIMDEVPEIQENNVLADFNIKGGITFRNLSFTYPGTEKPVLKNLDINLECGKTLAIVGRTGSGKTTLANLVTRLYNVTDGMLFIDGTDINRIPLPVLRNAAGSVPQDTFLFSSTIGDNINFYSGKTEDEIVNASKTAMIYDDIMEYPDRFETQVGERGVTLSGGQKQRVAIARAILRSPAILILDDCLSAVDTRTEEGILKGLKNLMKQRTSIIISHRISAIKDADEIIVLENGEIVERGDHEFLLSLEGEYHSLYQKQLLAEQIEGVE
ncbi:MAG: ABC transporter ATP-binding protein, partial [Ruminiclostridium sp.]|nr:ABC transporter ATP-binding protein [Ruminiclostridium sp.]